MDWRFWLRLSVAIGCAAAAAWIIWVLEWFDVFRWGIPGPQQLAVYAIYTGAAAAVGWGVASLLARRGPSH